LTTEILIIRALERGLSLSDFNEMTVGMLIDFIVTYNNEKIDHEEEEERFATQNDFDRF
jgi:hypothetical protein